MNNHHINEGNKLVTGMDLPLWLLELMGFLSIVWSDTLMETKDGRPCVIKVPFENIIISWEAIMSRKRQGH